LQGLADLQYRVRKRESGIQIRNGGTKPRSELAFFRQVSLAKTGLCRKDHLTVIAISTIFFALGVSEAAVTDLWESEHQVSCLKLTLKVLQGRGPHQSASFEERLS
jgi:hypothetical protein